ncbi:ATP-dependent acyl-CoA ligase [Rhizobium laguerreae]|uniref:class I adenylate-forming enzyme family protein n=1 Tax=Rhizobium laguerreae TaxID=1076926 RepID=UPI001C90BB20|nr:AMP-binding protein [Rhizobium laguerreae]MBY3516575.1 ATP-dependent acyl-CoA ligase [Rhizobium laguerreae]
MEATPDLRSTTSDQPYHAHGPVTISGLVASFKRLAKEAPGRIFACDADGSIPFGQLAGDVDALASYLNELGLRPGDRVLVMMRNSRTTLALIYAILQQGLVWVPMNPLLIGPALDHAVTLVKPTIAICDVDLVETLVSCEFRPNLGVINLPDTLPAVDGHDRPEPAPQDLAALMFTSGTTGPSKAVMVTHIMLELAAKAVIRCADARDGDNFYVWEPFHHIGGAQVLLLPLFSQVVLTLRDRFSASRFWQEVSESRCTHIHHLGGIIQILLRQNETKFDRDHNVRIAWGGGCAIDAWRLFESRFGLEIRECYGMTESSSLTTFNAERLLGSVGRPLPWFEVSLKDEDGRVIPFSSDEKGQIVVTTNQPGAIFSGYFNDEAATNEALRPDGFHTGDLGSWDPSGMLMFHGRQSDSVRCRGENVSAFEVESVANQHVDVEESAMAGVPAEIGEYDIHLFVRPRTGASIDPEQLYAWLLSRLAPFQRPRYISVVPEFPKTASHRVQKSRLLEAYHERWDSACSSQRVQK